MNKKALNEMKRMHALMGYKPGVTKAVKSRINEYDITNPNADPGGDADLATHSSLRDPESQNAFFDLLNSILASTNSKEEFFYEINRQLKSKFDDNLSGDMLKKIDIWYDQNSAFAGDNDFAGGYGSSLDPEFEDPDMTDPELDYDYDERNAVMYENATGLEKLLLIAENKLNEKISNK